MIKVLCDRCGKEIEPKATGIFADFIDGLSALCGKKGKYELYTADERCDLCKKCNEDLQRFMQKTEIFEIREAEQDDQQTKTD